MKDSLPEWSQSLPAALVELDRLRGVILDLYRQVGELQRIIAEAEKEGN